MTRWKCRKCSYIYDPRVGDPDGGIPAGTPFDKIPDSWRCPVCGVTKRDFYSLGTPQPAPSASVERRPPPPAASAPPSLPAPRSAGPPALAPASAHSGWTVGPLKRR